jgi:RND family efflux transporter MFP subunit
MKRLALLVGLIAGCAQPPPAAPSRPRPVRVALIASADTSTGADFSANIRAQDASQLSFRVNGTLTKVKVKRGDTVKKGQLLASLDESDIKVQLAQAQANASSARSQRDQARSSLRRVEKLYASGAATRSDYDNAKAQLRTAGSQYSASNQAAKQARNSLKYAQLKAPFGGVVNTVNVRVGETVGPGAPVLVISRGGQLEVNFGVPEGMVSNITAGQKVTVVVPALDEKKRPGTVSEVGFAPERNTYPVAVVLDAPDPALRPGMAAKVRFKFGEGETHLVVPVAAVGNEKASNFVFVIEGEGEVRTVHKRAIEVGELSGEAFVLEKGLKAGDQVATAGLSSLVDGMQVRLLKPEAHQ